MSRRCEIAARPVRAGERSARSVVEEHLAAIDAREAELHAFNLVMRDEALAAADAIDAQVAAGEDPGPLAGVPIALKDNLCTTGVPTTCSSKILEGWKPPYDATVVERLAAAGRDRHRQDEPRRVRHGQLHRELGLRARRRTRTTPPRCPAVRPAAARWRWRPGSRRSASAPTPVARSASPPRCAAWSA